MHLAHVSPVIYFSLYNQKDLVIESRRWQWIERVYSGARSTTAIQFQENQDYA